MKSKIKIVIIGAGQLSSHLITELATKKDTFQILQIFNHKNSAHAKKIAKKVNATFVCDYSQIVSNADFYLIAVKDEAILEVAKNLSTLNLPGIIAHTSGSTDISELSVATKNSAVFYPLQSFTKDVKIKWSETPILIEASNKKTLYMLKKIATVFSQSVKVVDSKTRLILHLSAVFANNFTNALFCVAYQLIENNLSKKDVKLLSPIIQQSFKKLKTTHPLKTQSGPAKRNDMIVMQKHLQILHSNKQLTEIYKQLSHLIIHQQKTSK